MHIGARLKRLRKNKGIGQSKICEGLVSPSHYSNIESGRYEASPEVLKSIAERLSVPANYLLGTDDYSPEIAALLNEYADMIDSKQFDKASSFINKHTGTLNFISSIKQETDYLLMRCLHEIQKTRVEEGRKFFDEASFYLTKKNLKYFSHRTKFNYYYTSGLLYFYDRKFKESINMYAQALRRAENEKDEAKMLYNTALAYLQINEIRKAITNTNRAKNILSKIETEELLIHVYILLGVLYFEISEFELATDELKNGLVLTEENNYEEEKAKILHNLGLVFSKTEDYNEALEYFFKSLKIKTNISSPDKFITYYSILNIYSETEDTENLNKYLILAKNEATSAHEEHRLNNMEANMEFFNGNRKKYEQLKEESLNYFYENEHWLDIENEAKKLSKYFFDLRKYKKAYQYLEMENQALEYLYKDRA